MNRRENNIRIFENTKALCGTHPTLKASIEYSQVTQAMISENQKLDMSDLSHYAEPANIIVSKKRTYEAANAYTRLGLRTAVLNFASASNPGGGVVNGSSAQEESLCRCSTLYFCLNTQELWDRFYTPHRKERNPLHNDDCIYTPGVTVFKSDTDEPKLLPERAWYKVDVLSCAAPNLRPQPSNRMNPADGDRRIVISDEELKALHCKRLHRILSIAAANNDQAFILGAFGCGAFMNDPEIVASAARETIRLFSHTFKTIEFAVYCLPGDDMNYRSFQGILK